MSSRPRSKSARGTRILGTSLSNPSHQRVQMEYTFIKSIVEAYCQQCMPGSHNKIPVRADKWKEGTIFPLDLRPATMATKWPPRPMGSKSTAQWTAKPMGRKNTAQWMARLMGNKNTVQWMVRPMEHQDTNQWTAKPMENPDKAHVKGHDTDHSEGVSSSKGQPRPRTPYRNEYIPQNVRHVFQRNSRTMEKVLPVWSPELKGDIIFSQEQRPTTSVSIPRPESASQRQQPVKIPRPLSANIDSPSLIPRPVSASIDSTLGLTRRGAPSSKVTHRGAIHSPLSLSPKAMATHANHQRPQTVGSLPSTARDETHRRPSTSDRFLPQQDGSKVNEQGQEGLTQTSHKQRLLSLDIFLPRETEFSLLGDPNPTQTLTPRPTSGRSRKHNDKQIGEHNSARVIFPSGGHSLSESVGQGRQDKNDNPTSKGGAQSYGTCQRFHDNDVTKADQTSFRSSCKKWIHCELFGPTLCSDCRIEQEKTFLRDQTMSKS